MRLIDADKLKEYMDDGMFRLFLRGEYEQAEQAEKLLDAFFKDVDEQPTAFDVNRLYQLLGEWDSSFAVTSDFRGTALRKAYIKEFSRMIEEAKTGALND